MLGAVMFAHEESRKVIGAIIDLAEQAAKEPWELDKVEDKSATLEELRGVIGDDLVAAYKITDKGDRQDAVNAARAKAREHYASLEKSDPAEYMGRIKLVKNLESDIVRRAILKDGQRIDGRRTDEVRPIEAQVGLLPRTHGSALFTRGETQAICTTTLGTKDAEQMIDGLEGLSYNPFMLHYNFPPYSVGEVGRFGFTSRRETGHGKLAWRALHPVLPDHEEFPYTIRVLSDITESNGSSLDGDRVRRVPGDDGRRRSDRAAGFGHCDGADPRGRGLHRAVRHPGRRGSPRRHGFQGRRVGEGHHLAPDGHQGRGHHARDHADRAGAGQGGPCVDPRQDERRARFVAGRGVPSTRRGSRRCRSTRPRSAT